MDAHKTRTLSAAAAGGAARARARIVAAARSHFLAHGFRSVTMDDLAGELGMSKKTFYAHFESKAALLEAVLADKIDGLDSELERITTQRDGGFIAALHGLLSCVQKHTGEIQPVFLRDLRRDAAGLFDVVAKRRAAIIQRCFTRLLNDGRKAGMVRDDLPVRIVIEILLAATQGIMNPQRLDELKLTPKAGYSAILDVILRGVMTAEGRSMI